MLFINLSSWVGEPVPTALISRRRGFKARRGTDWSKAAECGLNGTIASSHALGQEADAIRRLSRAYARTRDIGCTSR